MKKMVMILAVLMIAGSFLFAGGNAEPAAQAEVKVVNLKLGYGAPTSNPRHLAAEQFAAWVKDKSNGTLTIDLYPAEMLGTDRQMGEAVSMGTLDMSINAHGVVAAYEPKLAALELPFLFSSPEKVDLVLDGPIGKELVKDLPAKGIRVLAFWENGLRQITNNRRPIENPSDLNGLKLRTPENKMTLDIFKALGASPAPLAFSELYMALSQGVFDGQENPITNIHAAKFDEVQKYISITNHKYESCPMIISEAVWNKLSPEHQAILTEGAIKFAAVHREMVRSNEANLLADLESKGMIVSRPNTAPFQAATASVYTKWADVLGQDLINRITAATK